MATDLYFSINDRDLVVQNGDFELISECSVQNASILKEARVFDPLNPVYGIGLYDTLNANLGKMQQEMSRWQDQCKRDGATVAKFTLNNTNKVTDIEISVSYD